MVQLRHSPGITGGYTYAGEHYRVKDGVLDVDDEDVARAMVESERKISWLNGPPENDETPGVDGDKDTFYCGVNDCSREVDSPEDVCWQHPDD